MLTSIKLTNFKSFQHAEAPLGPFTLIVGTNASGKSNLRDALRVLHGIGLRQSLAEVFGDVYGHGGLLLWRGIRGGTGESSFQGSGAFGIEASVLVAEGPRMPSEELRYGLVVDVEITVGGPRLVREYLHSGELPIFDAAAAPDAAPGSGYHVTTTHPLDEIGTTGSRAFTYSGPCPLLIQLAIHKDEPGFVGYARRIMANAFAEFRFLDLDPDAMRIPSQPGQHILGDRGENLSSVLQAICHEPDKKATLLQWLRALTPMDVVDFTFRTDFTGKVLVHLKEASGFEVSAFSASDGTLRFLAIIAALLSRDSGQIYFFEEFDNGIHPTRLHLLLELVQNACRTMGVQVIGTTHNPALLAFLDDEARRDALLVYRSEHSPASRIVPIMSLPRAAEIMASQDLGRLHQAGWLEDAAIFSEEDNEDDVEVMPADDTNDGTEGEHGD
jgi:predicted ATPase